MVALLHMDSPVVQDILLALQDEDMIDLSLEGYDGIPVRANRFLLSARSKVLKRMLYGNFQESKSTTISLRQFDSVTLEAIVEFCSKNEIPKFRLLHLHRTASCARRLVHLFQAADYLELTGLANLVAQMAHNLCTRYPPLACAVYDEADLDTVIYNDAQLILQCRPYVTLPPHIETGGGIPCLSENRLIDIMQDEEVKAGELFLFQMLKQWVNCCEMYDTSDATRIAKICGEYLALDFIEPQELLGQVQSSGFCSTQRITEAITMQALKASHNRVWSLSTRGIPNSERILVEGAGSRDVNGLYYRIEGLANGVLYSKREVACGQQYVYTLSCTETNNNGQGEDHVECRIFCSSLLTHMAVTRLIQKRGGPPAGVEDHDFQPLMQVFLIEDENKTCFPPNIAKDRRITGLPNYPKILLSDGEHYIVATMAPELSKSDRRKELIQNSLIKLLRYEKYVYDGRLTLKLHKVSLISQDPGHPFGNPIDFYDALKDEKVCFGNNQSGFGNEQQSNQHQNEPAVVTSSSSYNAPIETQVCQEFLLQEQRQKQQQQQQQNLYHDSSSKHRGAGLFKLYSCHYPIMKQQQQLSPQHSSNNSMDWKIPRTGWTVEVHGEAPGPKITWIPASPPICEQQQQESSQQQQPQQFQFQQRCANDTSIDKNSSSSSKAGDVKSHFLSKVPTTAATTMY